MVDKTVDFRSAIRYSWVITASDYSNLRNQDFDGFDDIETVDTDRKCMLRGLAAMKFPKETLVDMVNPSREEVHAQVTKFKDLFLQNIKEGKTSFLFVYYGGHGCAGLGPYQSIILNEKTKAAAYQLEDRLRDFSMFNKHVSVLSIFDCSRVPSTPGITAGNHAIEKVEYDKLVGSFGSNSSYFIKYSSCSPGD